MCFLIIHACSCQTGFLSQLLLIQHLKCSLNMFWCCKCLKFKFHQYFYYCSYLYSYLLLHRRLQCYLNDHSFSTQFQFTILMQWISGLTSTEEDSFVLFRNLRTWHFITSYYQISLSLMKDYLINIFKTFRVYSFYPIYLGVNFMMLSKSFSIEVGKPFM